MEREVVSVKEGTGKSGIIKDDDGYYKVPLGRLNAYNRIGIFYEVDDIAALLNNENSVIGRRIETGVVRVEYQHPDLRNMSQRELVERIIFIDMDRVCGHIKSVTYEITNETEVGWESKKIINMHAWVKPSGPFGKYLEESLSNESENVSLSIRSLVIENNIGATVVRKVVDIGAWDFVHEHGVKVANQWAGAGIEAMTLEDGNVCLTEACIANFDKLSKGTESIEGSEFIRDRLEQLRDEDSLIFRW